MKQRTRIPLAVPANATAFINALRLERHRTIFDLFRQFCGLLALLAMGMAQAAPVPRGELKCEPDFVSRH
jgi:hypothetical protein